MDYYRLSLKLDFKELKVARKNPKLFREEKDTCDLHNDWVTALRREQERKVGALLDRASAPKFDPRKKFKEVKFTTLEAHSQLDSYITEARKQAQEIKVRKVEIHSLMAMNF